MTKLEDMQQLLEYLKSKQHSKELSENMLFAMYTILMAKDGGAKAFMAIADNDIEQSRITDGMSEELTEQINTPQGNWTKRVFLSGDDGGGRGRHIPSATNGAHKRHENRRMSAAITLGTATTNAGNRHKSGRVRSILAAPGYYYTSRTASTNTWLTCKPTAASGKSSNKPIAKQTEKHSESQCFRSAFLQNIIKILIRITFSTTISLYDKVNSVSH